VVKEAFVAAFVLTTAIVLAWWLSSTNAPRPAPAATVASDRGRVSAGADADAGAARGEASPTREARGQAAQPVAEIERDNVPGSIAAPPQRVAAPPQRVAAPPQSAPEVVEPIRPDVLTPLPEVAPPPVPEPASERPVVAEREVPPAAPAPPARSSNAPSSVELTAVQGVVRRYEQTYRQLDAKAVAAIWPSVDTRSLSRMFERIERQDLRFDTCAYAVSEVRATATCAGSLTYVPRVGGSTPRTDRHTWSIQLERAGQQWQIIGVSAQ
jgi:hypothetical protein